MDETDVVIECQQGNRDAFRYIVETYGDTLFGTAFLMTRDRAAAEDIVQSSLLLAWKGIPRFKAGTNLKAWLVRILVNQVMSQRRRKQHSQSPLDAAATRPATTVDGLEAVLESERQQEIQAALYTLDDRTREAIVLRYFAEMSIKEIAQTLKWAEGTVKSRIHRGLASLRTHFDATAPSLVMALEE